MFRPLTALVCLAVAPFVGDDDAQDKAKPAAKVIPAAEARNHVGEECTVEMTVKSSKNAAPRNTYFLDSEEDFHDEKNLAVIISYDHADKFKAAGIDDPADHYRGKAIRVTGKIINEEDQVRIHVEDPKQITLVEPS